METSATSSIQVSASGMAAQRKRMEAIAKNLANADSVARPGEDVYKAVRVDISQKETTAKVAQPEGPDQVSVGRTNARHMRSSKPDVRIKDVSQREQVEGIEQQIDTEAVLVYEPGHPYAGEDGYVRKPDINPIVEMVSLMEATRAYEANLAALKNYQDMYDRSIEI